MNITKNWLNKSYN